MAFEKIKKFINDDPEVLTSSNTSDEYYVADKNAKEINPNGSKMILLEPRAYSESQQIADYLKKRSAVVVNLKRVTPDQAKRIVDFLSGTLYALGGDLQKLGNGIFLCTPNNVNVEGKMSSLDDKSKGKKEDTSEFEF